MTCTRVHYVRTQNIVLPSKYAHVEAFTVSSIRSRASHTSNAGQLVGTERVASRALAVVRPHRVAALHLTAAIARRALVHVYSNHSSQLTIRSHHVSKDVYFLQ